MNSIWTKSTDKPHFKSLSGDMNTDVLIVGGGITGILCAYMLQKAKVDYILIEAKEICSGITKNTTAKITAAMPNTQPDRSINGRNNSSY